MLCGWILQAIAPAMIMRQLVAELFDCNAGIEDIDALLETAKRAAERAGATTIGEAHAEYQPHGLTAIVFLAESHILLTTWPEINLLLVDVLLCNPDMSTATVLEEIKAQFCPEGTARTREVERVIGAMPKAMDANDGQP